MGVEDIRKITVVGAGAMESQIAMVCALAGYQVSLVDVVASALDKAKTSLQGHMDNRVKKRRLTSSQVREAFAN